MRLTQLLPPPSPSSVQPKWTVANGEVSFNVGAAQRKQVPSVKLITNTLAYASELERIV